MKLLIATLIDSLRVPWRRPRRELRAHVVLKQVSAPARVNEQTQIAMCFETTGEQPMPLERQLAFFYASLGGLAPGAYPELELMLRLTK